MSSTPVLQPPVPLLLSRSLSLSLLFVSATHTRSRGYVVEPPRGHRIIIGWQVTRTLSPGFNWPIIVARIDGAAGPDRRETFGVACSPSDTTRLSVTNISWQEGANARADRGIQGEGAGMGKSGRKGRDRGCMGIEKGRSRGSRASICVRTVPKRVYSCAADGWNRDQNREHERAQIGHGWSVRSPCRAPRAALRPSPRSAARSLYQPLSPSPSRHRAPCLSRQLANLPTRVPFRNY